MATKKLSLGLLLIAGLATTAACGDPEDPSANNCDLACPAIEDVCDGDTVVKTSNMRASGKCACDKEETRTDCAANGQICKSGACVDEEVDACKDVVCDMPPADSCEGDTAVNYPTTAGTCADGTCSYTPSKIDCTTDNKVCKDGACVDAADPCANVTCDMPPMPSCAADVLTTYADPGMCDAGNCTYAPTETNCADDNKVCMNGACIDAADPCANVTCDMPPADKCDGTNAVTYTAAGMCDMGNCTYMETTTDCAADNKSCTDGKCVDVNVPPAEPVAGDIVITEIMYDTDVISDTDGEWFEVYNASGKTLDLRGLVIGDSGNAAAFTVPANEPNFAFAPDTYYVFGRNSDMAANGGVAVDIAYSAPSFNNGGDIVILTNASGAEIARVDYSAMGWDDPKGSSLQLDGQLDPKTAYSAGPMGWCVANMSYDTNNNGTPGLKNTDCPSTVAAEFTIKQLQDENDAMHPVSGTKVIVKGVVVSANGNDHAWVQDVAGGEYSGIYLDVTAATAPMGATVGTTLVDVEGTYEERSGHAVISVTSVTNVGNAATPLQPQVINSSILSDPVEAEKWEGVLIKINEAAVTNENSDAPGNDFGEFTIDGVVRVNDLLFAQATPEANCDLYASIAGPLNFSFGDFKIEPRDANDYGAKINVTLTPTATAGVAIANTAGGFTPANLCVNKNTAVTWTNGDTIAHTATSRDPSLAAPNNIPAQPAFDVALPAAGMGSFTFANSGTFHYRCRPHAAMEGVVIVLD